MDIEDRLAAIEKMQLKIIQLLTKKKNSAQETMPLKKAADYVGYSPDHFRRLAVEQRIIPFSRPSGQPKGKLLFRKADLDRFLGESINESHKVTQSGRKRKSKNIYLR